MVASPPDEPQSWGRRPEPFRLRALVLCLTLASRQLFLGASDAGGQEGALRLRGRVMLGEVAVNSATVVLHRVTAEAAGEVDSVSVVADGSFEFAIPREWRLVGGAEVLFASVRHGGVLYFGSAVSDPDQLDSLYVITVFDSEETPRQGLLLPVSVRTLFLEQSGEGWRATDLLQILNSGERTLVAPEDGVVWRYPLPPEATSPQLGQGDLPPDAVTFEGGRVSVRAPLAPGERMLSIRYELPRLEAEIPAPGRTDRLNLFVREPTPSLDVVGLQAIDVVALDSESTYRRYSGIDLRDALVSLEEASEGGPPSMGIFAAVLAALLGAAGLLAYLHPRRRAAGSGALRPGGSAAPTAGAPAGPDREGLILRVVRLDESLEATTDPEARRAMLEERTALIARLRAQS